MWSLVILIASAGVSSTVFALWRAAKAEARAQKAEMIGAQAKLDEDRWKTELTTQRADYLTQITQCQAEIVTLKTQRKAAIDALENYSNPGALRSALRVSLGIAPDSKAR